MTLLNAVKKGGILKFKHSAEKTTQSLNVQGIYTTGQLWPVLAAVVAYFKNCNKIQYFYGESFIIYNESDYV